MHTSTFTEKVRPRSVLAAFVLVVSAGCGGGADVPTEGVAFEGFSFRLTPSITVDDPPFEVLDDGPLSFGAPLDTVVVFHFDGVPEGPFGPTTLPVTTTPDQIGIDIPLTPGSTLFAQGSYAVVGHTVEFRPFVPTAPLDPTSTDPAAVPGLLPATIYEVAVVDVPGSSLKNLQGPGGATSFGTTSIESAYYPPADAPYAAPALVAATDDALAPRVFDPTPHGFAPTVAAGAESVTLSYDRALMPTAANLEGTDVDGDGVVEPTWGLRARSSDVLVGHAVAAGSGLGNPEAFGALAAFGSQAVPPADGSALVVTTPTGTEASSMAFARDGAALFVLLESDDGTASLTAVDHVTGDASGAAAATQSIPLGAELTGLSTHVDGRLLAVDTAARRIVEIRAELARSLPHGAPELLGVDVGPGGGAFAGDPWPSDTDVVDLVGLTDGRLLALVDDGAGSGRRLVETVPFDPTASGTPAPDAGWPTGPTLLEGLPPGLVDLHEEGPTTLLGIDRDLDAVVRVDLASGAVTPVVMEVSSYGAKPGGARCLALAFAHHDVDVDVVENAADGAVVTLTPRGLLPFGADLDVLESPTLASLLGTHPINTSSEPLHRLGRRVIHRVGTVDLEQPESVVHDVFLESFDDTTWQGDGFTSLPPALWAAAEPDGSPSSALQNPVPESYVSLGDFRPLASPGYDPDVSLEANLVFVYLDTAAQSFPLPSGATPDQTTTTTVEGGRFVFDDFVVPEGVCVKAVGPNPLDILVTGDVRIDGVIDVSGVDGLGDDTFDTGFYPVPGGAGGPGAGRGGNGHPTLSNPTQLATPDQYVTPEAGERGFGPRVLPSGVVAMLPIGGHGGLCTLGYDPDAAGYPRVPNASTQANSYNGNEHHRPPGGGGGSFGIVGRQAHEGTGAYLVESSSTWFPFSRCTFDDKRNDALYGNEANVAQGLLPATPLQCVYLDGTLDDPERKKPGGLPGDRAFVDDDPGNDYIGTGGELSTLIGGQGGGGGGSRVDSIDHLLWSADKLGSPVTPGYPYPKLFSNVALSPTRYDAKGGGGGGGGGAIRIRAHGDLLIGRTGRIDASGGAGGGGEIVQASSWAGGGGGGSGGAVLLSAAGDLVLEADPGNRLPSIPDSDGARGATIDVSGGLGKDARTSPRYHTSTVAPSGHASRSDGGQGGFGLAQLVSAQGAPRIEQGAYVHARVRAMLKLGAWTDPLHKSFGAPFPSAGSASDHPFDREPHPRELWYYDLLHYRGFRYEDGGPYVRDLVVHGADPGVVTPHADTPAGPFQLDTPMTTYLGRRYVREPEPQFVLTSWFGLEDDAEILDDPDGDGPLPPVPGTFFAPDADIPLNVDLDEPSGTPLYETVAGQQRLRLDNLVPRLPMVHPDLVPFDLTLTTEGRSRWIDMHGASLRTRDALGRAPPLFDGLNGVLAAATPTADAGEVITSVAVPGIPAAFVANTPGVPFDPGLVVDGVSTDEPFNDVKVDAKEWSVENAIGDGATVRLSFQGAFGVRHGSSTPDPQTITDWTADLAALSGYPLLRFRVVLDVDDATGASPQPRPSVDWLRLRMRY